MKMPKAPTLSDSLERSITETAEKIMSDVMFRKNYSGHTFMQLQEALEGFAWICIKAERKMREREERKAQNRKDKAKETQE